MIERIDWNRLRPGDELPSAFMRGKGERPLRVTLHSNSLARLSLEEMAAVAILREFGHLPEIQLLETDPDTYPHIEIRNSNPKDDLIPVEIISKGAADTYTGIWFAHQWPEIAAHLVGRSSLDHEDVKAMLEVLLVARAHWSVGGDILVTASDMLLQHRSKDWLKETNPRTPLEAVQIVGLFLRSRGVYVYSAGPSFKRSVNRGLYYWVLARHRLPSMWKYFSTCVRAGKARGDNLTELGESILLRCVRALEARDSIGIWFHVPQSKDTQDQMMYHFDYLSLLLAGALDAQAIVAKRAYQIDIGDKEISFRQKKNKRNFRSSLESKGAEGLSRLFDEKFDALLTLLHELRNTIHKAALKTISVHERRKAEYSLAIVPSPLAQELLEASQQLGGLGKWGLTLGLKEKEILLEPYSYATALVAECLNTINAIAEATDVDRLFPTGHTIPTLKAETPGDEVFKWAPRIALLG